VVRLFQFAVVSLSIAAVVLAVLVFGGRSAPSGDGAGLVFADVPARDAGAATPLQSVAMRDGYPLRVRKYNGAEDVPLLVLVHGPTLDGEYFDSLANALRGKADVIVPDLRGHGTAPGRRGDIDYIGQLEDDLADLIAAVAKPDQAVIMGGHSWGGGLVIRFAGGTYGDLLDGAVLLAPFLDHTAPNTRENSGGGAQLFSRRIMGLDILNTLGITALNHLPVIQFGMPVAVRDDPLDEPVTTAFSYTLNASFTPRRAYLEDVAALPPFVLLAGSADEAFISSQYAPTMGPVTDNGRFDMILGASHLGLVDDPRTLGIIEGFLDGY